MNPRFFVQMETHAADTLVSHGASSSAAAAGDPASLEEGVAGMSLDSNAGGGRDRVEEEEEGDSTEEDEDEGGGGAEDQGTYGEGEDEYDDEDDLGDGTSDNRSFPNEFFIFPAPFPLQWRRPTCGPARS